MLPATKRVVFERFLLLGVNYRNIFWSFGKLVAYGRWSQIGEVAYERLDFMVLYGASIYPLGGLGKQPTIEHVKDITWPNGDTKFLLRVLKTIHE